MIVNIPTRPINISKPINPLLAELNSGVTFILSPTVDKAETTSKRT